MSNAIVLPEDALANQTTGEFGDLAKAGDWLPQLRLVLASSPLVAQKKCGIGNYALVKSKENVEDLGDQVAVYPIAWRSLALDTTSDPIVSVYDQNDPRFKEFQKKGLEDSNSGFLAGPQFLLWVPQAKLFATFFMASKTMKNKAEELLKKIPNAVTLKSTPITKGKYHWYGPVITDCSLDLETPIPEVLAGVVKHFRNPPAPELAKDAGRADR